MSDIRGVGGPGIPSPFGGDANVQKPADARKLRRLMRLLSIMQQEEAAVQPPPPAPAQAQEPARCAAPRVERPNPFNPTPWERPVQNQPLPQVPQAPQPAGWTREALLSPFTAETLRAQSDPDAFIRARLAAAQPPSQATDALGQPLNVAQMATREQALEMQRRIAELGFSLEIRERESSGPYGFNYGSDPRRHFQIGEMNVGLLVQRYAQYPKEVADRMTQAELAMLNRQS